MMPIRYTKFWTTSQFKKNLVKITIIIGVIVLFAFVGINLYFLHLDTHFTCSHPKLKLIHKGLTKKQVMEVLDSPDQTIIKPNMNDYTFAQGEMEKTIKEGWIYRFFGWDGDIEIYFDENGIVNGKNCGHG